MAGTLLPSQLRSHHISSIRCIGIGLARPVSALNLFYVLGNPPFAGPKHPMDAQRAQVRRIAALGKCGGMLDFLGKPCALLGEFDKPRASTELLPHQARTDCGFRCRPVLWPRVLKKNLQPYLSERTEFSVRRQETVDTDQ